MHVAASTGRTVAGRYLLQNTIGRGAMGTVWRARDTVLARDVAVKEVRLRGPVTAGSVMTEETRVLYQALVGSGATIAEINAVRKHFSAVKGGRLAAAAHPR